MALISYKKIVQIACLCLFFIFIIVYGIFVAHDLLFGVKIQNVNIVDGSEVTNSVLHITGTAENAIDLTLNGREISVDQQGNFDETIALLPGYNIIDLKAKDKFGYTNEKIYKLMH